MSGPIEGEHHPSPVDGNSNSPIMPDALPFSPEPDITIQPQIEVKTKPNPFTRLRKLVRYAITAGGVTSLMFLLGGCDVIDPVTPAQAKGPENGSHTLYDPTLTYTPAATEAATEIFTATPRPTKTPRPTATMKPEPSPTTTLKPPEPSPTVTATKVMTAEVTPQVENDWTKGLFFSKDEIPEGAIILEGNASNWSKIITTEQGISGPGKVFYKCNLQTIVQRNISQGRYLASMRLDLNQPNNNYCVSGSARLQDIEAVAAEKYPTLTKTQKKYVDNIIALSKAFTDAVLAHKGPLYMDAYTGVAMDKNSEGKIAWYTFNNPYPLPPDYNWPLGDAIDMPLPTPTPSPTP